MQRIDAHQHFWQPARADDGANDASMRGWRRDVAARAAAPQASRKLSGRLTEMPRVDAASPARALERLHPIVDSLLHALG